MLPRVTILGVPIDPVTPGEAEEALCRFAASDGKHHVMTPNPEMLVEAARNPAFRDLLGRTALNVPDGAGLLLAARITGQRLPARVAGVDLLQRVAGRPELQPLFLLGAGPGIAEKTASVLAARNPGLRLAGTYGGSPAREEQAAIIERIVASGARSLFVAYGAPAQDLWIDRVLPSLPSVHVAMGVGGAFDFLAGVRSRAPAFLQRLGLEWLWRLVQEPSRIRRIATAVIVFPFLVLTSPSSRPRGDAQTR